MKLYDFFFSTETPFVFVHTSFCQHKQKNNDTGFFCEVGVAGAGVEPLEGHSQYFGILKFWVRKVVTSAKHVISGKNDVPKIT